MKRILLLSLMTIATQGFSRDGSYNLDQFRSQPIPITEGADARNSSFYGDICYHTMFNNIDISYSTFTLNTVMRFCNFNGVRADYTEFDGFLYSQNFTNSSLRGAVFKLRSRGPTPSQIKFTGCDLTDAVFYGDARFVTVDGIPLQETGITLYP